MLDIETPINNGAHGRTRTDTVEILSLLPPAIGLRGLYLVLPEGLEPST
jgi:hypothetical protein